MHNENVLQMQHKAEEISWYDRLWKVAGKIVIYAISLLFIVGAIIGMTNALDECKDIVTTNDIPCLIILPVNITQKPCSTITVAFYSNATNLFNTTMAQYTPNFCNATFNISSTGTYAFYYTTSDSGSITVQEDVNTIYYFWVIMLAFMLFLIWAGLRNENPWLLTLSGMLSSVIALTIYFNGFPNIDNEILKNWVSIVFAGIGMFLMVAPLLDWLGENFG